jgi:hypothetical protein
MLIALLLVSVPLWLKSLAWRVPPSGALTACLLLLGSFGAAQGIKLQQLTLLVAAVLAAAAAAITARWLTLAGVLLATSTIKPQLSVVLSTWFLLWAVSYWHKRWPLVASFAVTMSALLVGSELVLHGWIAKFLAALKAYTHYTNAGSILTKLLGDVTGLLLTAVLLLILARVAWCFRYIPADSPEFGQMTVLTLAVTMLIIPTVAAYNQVLLLPAILLLVRDWRQISRMGATIRLFYFLVAAIVIWPWVAAFILSALTLLGYPQAAQSHWAMPLYTTLMTPLGIMTLLGLYTSGVGICPPTHQKFNGTAQPQTPSG